MNRIVPSALVAVAVAGGVSIAAATAPDGTARPALFKSCSHFNAKYPHGVGRIGARED